MSNLTHFTKRARQAGLADLALPRDYHDRIGDAFIEATATRVAGQAQQIRQLYREHGFAVVLHLLMIPALSPSEVYDLRFHCDYVDTYASWNELISAFALGGRRRVTRQALRRCFHIIEIFGAIYVFRRPRRTTSERW